MAALAMASSLFVVLPIAETTTTHLDVLVATHEHWDHVSGFEPAKNWFKDFRIDKVWLAWTEDPDNATARKLRHDRAQKLAALWIGFGALKDRIQKFALRWPYRYFVWQDGCATRRS